MPNATWSELCAALRYYRGVFTPEQLGLGPWFVLALPLLVLLHVLSPIGWALLQARAWLRSLGDHAGMLGLLCLFLVFSAGALLLCWWDAASLFVRVAARGPLWRPSRRLRRRLGGAAYALGLVLLSWLSYTAGAILASRYPWLHLIP